MKRYALAAALLVLGGSPAAAQSDTQIRQRIVRQSIAAYSGQCPCPYSVMRNGRGCGARSAYSRPGGRAPLCYPSDVSRAEVDDWRRAQR
jgi:hypothetical protein